MESLGDAIRASLARRGWGRLRTSKRVGKDRQRQPRDGVHDPADSHKSSIRLRFAPPADQSLAGEGSEYNQAKLESSASDHTIAGGALNLVGRHGVALSG